VTNSVNKYTEDGANGSDSRFDQEVGHFAPKIRREIPQNTSRKTYHNGRTRCSQASVQTDTDRPHTFWLMMSSLDVGLGDGDDMVKAFGKQTQTPTSRRRSSVINPSVCGTHRRRKNYASLAPFAATRTLLDCFTELDATDATSPRMANPSTIVGGMTSLTDLTPATCIHGQIALCVRAHGQSRPKAKAPACWDGVLDGTVTPTTSRSASMIPGLSLPSWDVSSHHLRARIRGNVPD